ncbi:hypothetical protein [Streptomyces spectabilis]|uniref:Uncharacterized protein n=1 Tax=Streptomyces spectabilis TaxID=68270 RepID=A0A5P2XFE6_STRST|nr:hypothetical protein [Streptomyces spectabilis]MBB5103652.1 hypothetical protein [Streptomyces spectabilis]MCI3904103.1 hypothetical protein [Streptomyces spectabilis]QEV61236.1 hypothetical protein CP982_23100 [Streptomyces spectabilis]GGV19524.1 hypothetical protein GCM10010245_33130 [Streptomyces spectabilis]
MSVPVRSDQPEPADERALQDQHLARARSAYERAVAACRAAGIEPDRAEIVPTGPAARAANAVRLSARSLAEREGRAPDPAADARCARNAAATAATAAQAAHAHTPGDLTATALQAALKASQAAAEAAGGRSSGRDPTLTARADTTEATAVATARRAGWTGAAATR